MAEITNPKPTKVTLHRRHMVEFVFAVLALLVVVVAVGGYLYLTGPHQRYHCPTVTVATARC